MKRHIIFTMILTLSALVIAGCGQSPKEQLEQSTNDLFLGLSNSNAERVMSSIPEGADLQHLTREDVRERAGDGRGFPASFRNIPNFSSIGANLQNVKVLKFEPENKRAQFQIVMDDGNSGKRYVPIEQTNGLWHIKFD